MKPIPETQLRVHSADADISKKVRLVLNENRKGFRRISIWAEAGTVRLSGTVDSFYLRQLAVALTKRLAGVRHVIDDLKVYLEPTQSP